jgi:benzoyl-CoA reductase/2-hydroxyglutaryl-CoA dehydratase subunit BcrC/BadD/HgdB
MNLIFKKMNHTFQVIQTLTYKKLTLNKLKAIIIQLIQKRKKDLKVIINNRILTSAKII